MDRGTLYNEKCYKDRAYSLAGQRTLTVESVVGVVDTDAVPAGVCDRVNNTLGLSHNSCSESF